MAFLNTLPLPVLEESLAVFRENIFSMTERKQIPHRVYEILERQLIKEEHGLVDMEDAAGSERQALSVHDLLAQKDQAQLFESSKQIYLAMQTVLEFMDKGMKGLLTGDMSVFLLRDIERSIHKYERKFDALSNKMNDIVFKQETLDKFIADNFSLD